MRVVPSEVVSAAACRLSVQRLPLSYIKQQTIYSLCFLDLLAMTDQSHYWNNILGVVYPSPLM